MSQRIAIIGAGICGLVSLKEVLAAGLEAVCFDAREGLGGAWAYQPVPGEDPAASSSIYLGTMLNSCRDTSAFSDFPFDPARYPDYFGHRQFVQYLREYAAHFGLDKHVRLQTKVTQCAPQDDGSWTVTATQRDGTQTTEPYAAVIVAAGHLSAPRTPAIPGRDLFAGEALHSHAYRAPSRFEGKRVAVVGFGSSAVDIACEIAPHAASLHLVTRRGGWVLPRYVLGKPTEAFDNRATQLWLPVGLSQWLQTKLLAFVDGTAPAAMAPAHKILEQNPTIRGDFLEKVRTGLVQIARGDVVRMTAAGLVVQSTLPKDKKAKKDDVVQGSDEYALDVDVVIFATGYTLFDLPYLPPNTAHPAGDPDQVDLYKLILPLHQRNLFFHGYTDLLGPLPPAAEAQARYTAALLAGRLPPPSTDEKARGIQAFRAYNRRHFVHSDRHVATAHLIPYVDDLLAPLGAAPTFSKLLAQVFTSGHPLRALSVLSAVWFSIPSSAAWRLVGHGAKPDLAAATVLRTAGEKPALSEKEVVLLAKERVEQA
ncbi:hypothetical protein HMPREF1624_03790 [Sporothrix schenckii ATCC 58251]|uniref:Uncharacterized protein n=1 Tax=Sporothrix schenckii (strain ATCC 58251 / de Perez 2211183) TaxID=1391915 RepID=U7PXR8_SPOS1|nr:hypothetical protein HMPREF1624_03790 [Sporothrix schenckii ATCC 58251]